MYCSNYGMRTILKCVYLILFLGSSIFSSDIQAQNQDGISSVRERMALSESELQFLEKLIETNARTTIANKDNSLFQPLPTDPEYISSERLRDYVNKFNLIGFAGRSLAYLPKDKVELNNTVREVVDVLSQLNPVTDVIVLGGTDTGINGIVSRTALRLGFKVIILTALKGTHYSPTPAHGVYFEQSKEFGSESKLFARVLSALFAFSGGNQTNRETALMGISNKPVAIIDVGESATTNAAREEKGVKVFKSGKKAAAEMLIEMRKRNNSGKLQLLSRRYSTMSFDQLKALKGTTQFIGIAGSVMGPDSQPTPQEMKFVDDLLLQSTKINSAIIISGTKGGVETYAAEQAKKLGIKTVALLTGEFDPENVLDPKHIDYVVVSSKTWDSYPERFVEVADFIYSFGGRMGMIEIVERAIAANKSWLHLPGKFNYFDQYFSRFRKTNFVSDNDSGQENQSQKSTNSAGIKMSCMSLFR